MWSPFTSRPKYEALKGEDGVEMESTESLELENAA